MRDSHHAPRSRLNLDRATSNDSVVGGSNIQQVLQAVYPALDDEGVDRILEAYPPGDFSSAAQRFQVVLGESILICAVSPSPSHGSITDHVSPNDSDPSWERNLERKYNPGRTDTTNRTRRAGIRE